ncbi:nucleoside triphosphate pyrophosphohydrolase [Thermodesulfomicrobium sp. WS]|uniref:nucleoside triphosphate pyrophosphohydrolase n=1 Tax=Thermodesulfomicrobium sp. WS TaxID=3004129 RepID=UPI0024900143|nr:nucleoside triphosphate pyrophosphohydrolase [Thermodesulfomicrobium sp. WS]BDV01736.1 nucleoside triphosphate pyrophosphohydrolase [Thermodesulfomicrobium sp. WS]
MAPDLSALLAVIDTLLGPSGCPWDQKQTPHTLAEYLLEEACELVDAIRSGDVAACAEEWGDTLFILLFIGRLLERELPDFLAHATREAEAKMIRRHPHVYGEASKEMTSIIATWERIKKAEKAENGTPQGALDSVPASLPPLARAYRIHSKAARLGFTWASDREQEHKLEEEWAEWLAVRDGEDAGRKEEEFGDYLFSLVEHGRRHGIKANAALHRAIVKFLRRFAHMEALARAQGSRLEDLSPAAQDQLWKRAKREIG